MTPVAENPPRRRRWRLWLVVGLGVFGVVAAVALVVTGEPEFCASCHIMETRYVSWHRSAHEPTADCLDCHAEPGIVGEVVAHLNGLRYLWVKLTGGPATVILRGEVAEGTCIQCHDIEDLPTESEGVPIAHDAHVDLDVECEECHNAFHDDLGGGSLRAGLDNCDDCHPEPFQLFGSR